MGAIFRLKRASRLQDNSHYYKEAVSKDLEAFFITDIMPLSRICGRVQNHFDILEKQTKFSKSYTDDHNDQSTSANGDRSAAFLGILLIACAIIFKFLNIFEDILYRDYVRV
jgi:hypothetical protein